MTAYGVTLPNQISRFVGNVPYVLPGPVHAMPTLDGSETMPS